MPRNLSPEKQQELDTLYRTLKAFMEWQPTADDPSVQAAMTEVRERLERDYAAGKFSGWREALNDFVAMAQYGTPEQKRRLDGLLRDQAGISLDDLRTKQLARISKIRERGRITGDEQYYLVKERVEEIWDDPSKAEEFRALQAMLDAYEARAAEGSRGA
ncbi:MAG TPA: hypothetical protein VF041_08495 [Gemmatimonadaceae bacterium]